MVTHWQFSTVASEASGNSDLHYPKQEVNGAIQQQTCPNRMETYSFTSSYFSNPNSVVFPAVCSGYDLTMPPAPMSLANVQETSNCLGANQDTALPMPGVEALSSYMEELRLDAAAFSDLSFVGYSPAKADNPHQFRQATFSNYIPTQCFPDVNSQQYCTQPSVQTSPEIPRATSPYDTRWTYRDLTACQIWNKPMIRNATKKYSKKMHPRTGMPLKPSKVVKRPSALRSPFCIDRQGETSSNKTNRDSSFRHAANTQIHCNYGCGQVFSRADGCKRHMSFCPFRTEK